MTNQVIAMPDQSNSIATTETIYDGRRVTGAFAVNKDRMRDTDWSMSKQWAERPDDERFETFSDLLKAAKRWADISSENPVTIGRIEVSDNMEILLPNKNREEILVDPTHLAFTQLCQTANGIPAYWLRKLPVARAARILRESLGDLDQSKEISAYVADGGYGERTLRSLVFNETTRITNHELLLALQPFLGDLSASNPMEWKTPGRLNWGTMEHNPFDMHDQVSLFMGPEDMQCFVCKDANPIEIGKTRLGKPDIFFPGLMWGNSEVKNMSTWFTGMMLQGVCCNLSLRGVMGKKTHRINHTKNNSIRLSSQRSEIFDSVDEVDSFVKQVRYLKGMAIQAVHNSRQQTDKEEARIKAVQQVFLRHIGVQESKDILKIGFQANQHPVETMWDLHEAITETAKRKHIQEERREYEFAAYTILARAA